jgi:hypothetical protein
MQAQAQYRQLRATAMHTSPRPRHSHTVAIPAPLSFPRTRESRQQCTIALEAEYEVVIPAHAGIQTPALTVNPTLPINPVNPGKRGKSVYAIAEVVAALTPESARMVNTADR